MSQLQKVVNLIKKTGDKAIIIDEKGEPDYVIMTIYDYESLILGKSEVRGLTEDELLAKINREIAIWKESDEREKIPIDQYDFFQDLGIFTENYDNFNENDGFEPIGEVIRDMGFGFESVPFVENFSENQTVFNDSLSEDNNEEEDRFYFEPVE